MKNNNLGNTTLKRKRRDENSLLDYDRLPKNLRTWIANAELPWRPKSVLRAYERAYTKTGSIEEALFELSRLQHKLISRDACIIWGKNYPKTK